MNELNAAMTDACNAEHKASARTLMCASNHKLHIKIQKLKGTKDEVSVELFLGILLVNDNKQ